MKRFFLFLSAVILFAAALASCSQRPASVGSNKNPGVSGVIILHDEPQEVDREDPPEEHSDEPPEVDPDDSGRESDENLPDDPDPTTVHTHKYGSWIKKIPPSCTATGVRGHYHCSICGEVIVVQKAIPATGHTEIVDEAIAPTCTESGLTEGSHCSICGEIIVVQKAIPATGHTEIVDEAIAPTCTESGLTEGRHCSVCGEVIVVQEIVPAAGHDFGEWIEEIPATCICKGTKGHFTCLKCAHCFDACQIEIADLTIPRKTHRYKSNICIYCGERKPTDRLNFQTVGDDVCFLLGLEICYDLEIAVPSVAPTGELVIGIEQNAFLDSLCQTVYLPLTITEISSWAFNNCLYLTEIVYSGTVEEWEAIEKGDYWKTGGEVTIRCQNGIFKE